MLTHDCHYVLSSLAFRVGVTLVTAQTHDCVMFVAYSAWLPYCVHHLQIYILSSNVFYLWKSFVIIIFMIFQDQICVNAKFHNIVSNFGIRSLQGVTDDSNKTLSRS